MKVEKAVTRLPTWKVAECINRLEDWRDKKPQDGTMEPSNVPGCGEIRASETGLKPLAAGRLFLNIFTKNGRQILVEQIITYQSPIVLGT